MAWTPLYMDMDGKRVFVLGSGEVGMRRARRFLEAGAEVVVAGPPAELEGARFVEMDNLEYWVEWADLVVVASPDRELNDRVASLAGKRLLNRADSPLEGDVIVPSTFMVGDVSISIFTGTRSPLMARYLRERIQDAIQTEDLLMIEVQDRVRRKIREEFDDHRVRRRILYRISEDPELKEYLKKQDTEAALERAYTMIDEFRRGVLR